MPRLPQEISGLIKGLLTIDFTKNKLLLGSYFLGGLAFPLDSHDSIIIGFVSPLGNPHDL